MGHGVLWVHNRVVGRSLLVLLVTTGNFVVIIGEDAGTVEVPSAAAAASRVGRAPEEASIVLYIVATIHILGDAGLVLSWLAFRALLHTDRRQVVSQPADRGQEG